jgi:hypothetical protein
MYDTIEEIEALFNEESESFSLEYKSGHAFDNMTSEVRREFVKDVTAFANAGGGTLIVGVAEGREGARNIAAGFEPITNEQISVDQLTNIVKSNSDPVFSAFRIRSLAHEGGRVLVIEIDQADTAHQNRLDQRYYQRTGTIAAPMYDFAIRDVMNRRTRPRLSVKLDREIVLQTQNRHRYVVTPSLSNEGFLTVKHWGLWVDLPSAVAFIDDGAHGQMQVRGSVLHEGCEYTRCDFFETPESRILPGQQRIYSANYNFPVLGLQIDPVSFRAINRYRPPLRWTLFVDNGPRQDGALPFAEWCSW